MKNNEYVVNIGLNDLGKNLILGCKSESEIDLALKQIEENLDQYVEVKPGQQIKIQDIEAQMRADREKVAPIVEKVFSMAQGSNLNYREYKRMVDILIHDGARKFKIAD